MVPSRGSEQGMVRASPRRGMIPGRGAERGMMPSRGSERGIMRGSPGRGMMPGRGAERGMVRGSPGRGMIRGRGAERSMMPSRSAEQGGFNSFCIPPPKVDTSKPMTTIQVRLPTGGRIIVKLNETNLIRDLRQIIYQQRPEVGTSFTLHTASPPKKLTDELVTLKEAGILGAAVLLCQMQD